MCRKAGSGSNLISAARKGSGGLAGIFWQVAPNLDTIAALVSDNAQETAIPKLNRPERVARELRSLNGIEADFPTGEQSIDLR